MADSVERTGSIETIPFHVLPTIRVHNIFIRGVLWQSGLMGEIVRNRPQAVVFLGDIRYASTWLAAALLRAKRVPVLFWTIGWHRPEQGLKRLVRLVFYRLADSLLLYGDTGIQLGLRHGYPGSRMIRVGNSHTSWMSDVPLTADENLDLESKLRDLTENVVAAVVRLNAGKRLHLLILAAKVLKQRGMPTTVLLAGDGPEREALEAQARQETVDVRFLGAVYSEQALDRIYSVSDVTVLPSAAGLTVIQSLEHGTPVITDDDITTQGPRRTP